MRGEVARRKKGDPARGGGGASILGISRAYVLAHAYTRTAHHPLGVSHLKRIPRRSPEEQETSILLSDKHLHSVCSRIASGYRFEDHRRSRRRSEEAHRERERERRGSKGEKEGEG